VTGRHRSEAKSSGWLHCWASPWRKIAYSISHSITHSLTHSPSLFDAREPNNNLKLTHSLTHPAYLMPVNQIIIWNSFTELFMYRQMHR